MDAAVGVGLPSHLAAPDRGKPLTYANPMSDPIRPHSDDIPAPISDAAAAPEPASRWEDFLDILYAPSDVYTRRAGSGFGIPLLVVTVAIGLISLANSSVLQPLMDAEFQRMAAKQMAKDSQITMEMMERGRSIGETFAKIGGFILVPVAVFLTGLFLWLIGKFFDAKQTLAAALMVTAYAYVPRIIESVMVGVQGMLMDPASMSGRYEISLGVGRFLDPDTSSPMLLALLGRLDVFTIWVTVLLAIGLSVTGKIPRQQAAIAAVLLWLLGAVPAMLQALQG